MTKLYELELQGSLEYDGKTYQAGDIVEVPEDVYDYLTGAYLAVREEPKKDKLFELME